MRTRIPLLEIPTLYFVGAEATSVLSLTLFFFEFFVGNIEDILRMILPLTCSAVAKKQFQDSANGRVLVDYTTLRESISTESKSLIFFKAVISFLLSL